MDVMSVLVLQATGRSGRVLCLSVLFLLFRPAGGTANPVDPGSVRLANEGKALMHIMLPADATEVQHFAARELQRYLSMISGASFKIDTGSAVAQSQIRLFVNPSLQKEAYTVHADGTVISLTGGSGRAVLYAVYGFLGHLGCVWLAPDFSFYNGHSEFIPRLRDLRYNYQNDIREQPAFAFRKIDATGRNTDLKSLIAIIAWLPKLGFNTVQIPFGKSGAKWEKWRREVIPELRKRGLIIEVGGHGYQNFLTAGTDDKKLLKAHPDWFGRDDSCHTSLSERMVFNTENADAVHYFITRVTSYLRQHPEIDIFDLWPPDGATWPVCPRPTEAYSPQERQARLANQVDSAIKTVRSDIRLEIIAYDRALLPPKHTMLHRDILVDFCPINQDFEYQIDDPRATRNANYVKALRAWRTGFSGDVGIYAYYRKSAWRSLPNLIPHYIQRDMKWYSSMGLKGISCYAYHDDWFTYEINHYVLGRVAWDPDSNVDSLITLFCAKRYGQYDQLALSAYDVLEHVTRIEGSLPFTSLKPVSKITKAARQLKMQVSRLRQARSGCTDTVQQANLSRLLLMFQYLEQDLDIQKSRSQGESRQIIRHKVEKLLKFRSLNARKGVFQLSYTHEKLLLMKHYGLTQKSLLGL